jgi:hypothetical protein
VDGDEVPRRKIFKGLACQTVLTALSDTKGLFSALSNLAALWRTIGTTTINNKKPTHDLLWPASAWGGE